MPRPTENGSLSGLIPKKVLKEVRSIRPVRLYISKKRQKYSQCTPSELRRKFSGISTEKQGKYYQKAIDKFIELLDEKEIDENVQSESRIFDLLIVKTQQKKYFEWLNAPIKPPGTTMAFYHSIKRQENDSNPPAWKTLSGEERSRYAQMLTKAKAQYNSQMKNFAENLPDRIKPEYLLFAELSNRRRQSVSTMFDDDENSIPVSRRRKSMSAEAPPDSATTKDGTPKLNKTQLDQLHQCKPANLYYKRLPDEEKPSFSSLLPKNAHIRSVFASLNEKKKKKFIGKATQKWQNLLDQHPSIVEREIPTLHLLLPRNDDILTYFSALGLPQRPLRNAAQMFHLENNEIGSEKKWSNLSKEIKNEYTERWTKMKNDYHRNLQDFVEKTLPSDYMRQEFFRNVKHATIDYELSMKKSSLDDPHQSKITQYYQRKNSTITNDESSKLDRIVQQLFATDLTEEQKQLVKKIIKLIDKSKGERKNAKTSSEQLSDDSSVVEMEL